GVPVGDARRVSSVVHSVGLHFPDREHAGRAAIHHPRRAGALLPRGASRHRAQRTAPDGHSRADGRACRVRRRRPCVVLGEVEPAMRRRIWALMWKEFVELGQTPRLLVLIIIAPILQLTLLGYAATTDVRNVPIVVVDQDHSQRSRQLIEKFVGSPFFKLVREEPGVEAIDADLAHGRAWLALVIPSGFGDATAKLVTQTSSPTPQASRLTPQASTVQLIADGTDANSSGVAMAYASALIAEFGGTVAAESGIRTASIEGRIRVWFNPQLESRVFMLPGLI